MFCAALVQLATCCGVSLLSMAVGFGFGESLDSVQMAWAGGAGALGGGVGYMLWAIANLRVRSLGVNALVYLSPALGVGWLFLLSRVDVARPWWLALGVALIVSGNVAQALPGRRATRPTPARRQR